MSSSAVATTLNGIAQEVTATIQDTTQFLKSHGVTTPPPKVRRIARRLARLRSAILKTSFHLPVASKRGGGGATTTSTLYGGSRVHDLTYTELARHLARTRVALARLDAEIAAHAEWNRQGRVGPAPNNVATTPEEAVQAYRATLERRIEMAAVEVRRRQHRQAVIADGPHPAAAAAAGGPDHDHVRLRIGRDVARAITMDYLGGEPPPPPEHVRDRRRRNELRARVTNLRSTVRGELREGRFYRAAEARQDYWDAQDELADLGGGDTDSSYEASTESDDDRDRPAPRAPKSRRPPASATDVGPSHKRRRHEPEDYDDDNNDDADMYIGRGGLVGGAAGSTFPPSVTVPPDAVCWAAARDAYAAKAPTAIGDWRVVFASPTLRAYRKDTTILVSLRGTAGGTDAAANGAVVANALTSSARYKTDAAAFEQLLRAFPPPGFVYFVTGHSLGGAVATALMRSHPAAFSVAPGHALLFNAANQPIDLTSPIPGARYMYAQNDPLWRLASPWWRGRPAPTVVNPADATGLGAAHALSAFAGLYPDAPPPQTAAVARAPLPYMPPGGVSTTHLASAFSFTGDAVPRTRRFIVPQGGVPPTPVGMDPRPGTTGNYAVFEGDEAPSAVSTYADPATAAAFAAAMQKAADPNSAGAWAASGVGTVSSRLGLPVGVTSAFSATLGWKQLFGGSAASVAAAHAASEPKQAEIALSDGDIRTMVPGIRVLTYPELESARSIDDVLRNDDAVVILFLTESKTAGHWTAVLRHINNLGQVVLEYFDSYGGPPDAPFEWLTTARRHALDQTSRVLSRLLRDSPHPVDYNHARLQRQSDDVNTCGRHVVVRLWHRHERLREYIPWLLRRAREENATPDAIVTRATAASLAHLHAMKKDAT